ncbi:MAG TPA: NAD(P)H-dependent oxidoreductase [Gemmatimonadaceae bacterium]|nr:NAD(P)H-dependent oxidoreductase [Gemmatimonadaceae bacterium]
MPKVLVLFYSRTGRTAALADAIAEGAGSVKYTEVEVRRIEDLAPAAVIEADESWKGARAALGKKYRTLESVESLTRYDALIVGSPARSGIMSAELKHTLDMAGALAARGALADKVGSAFGSVSEEPGGHEMNVMSMLIPMMHFGMIIVPAGHGDASAAAAGDLARARQQGARVAKVAEWVRHAKSHEAHAHRH